MSGGEGLGWGGQGGCDLRIEYFVKIQKKIWGGGGGWSGGGGGLGWGCQGGCDLRIEFFVKIQKKNWGGGGGSGGGGGGGGGGGVGLVGGSGWSQVKSSQVKFYSVLILNKES